MVSWSGSLKMAWCKKYEHGEGGKEKITRDKLYIQNQCLRLKMITRDKLYIQINSSD